MNLRQYFEKEAKAANKSFKKYIECIAYENDISSSALISWVYGHRKPGLDSARKLSKALNMSLENLVELILD